MCNAYKWYRVVFALFIVNKAGSLIYQRDFAEGLQKLSTNEYIILAGTFHRYAFTAPLDDDTLTQFPYISSVCISAS